MMTRFLSSRRGSALESAAAAAAEPAGAGGRRGGRKEGRKETSGGGARRGDAAVTPLSVGAPSDPRPDRCAERRSALRRGDRGKEGGGGEVRAVPPPACGARPLQARRCGAGGAARNAARTTSWSAAAAGRAEPREGTSGSASPGAGPGVRETAAPSGSFPRREAQPPHSGWARGAVRLHAP